MAWWRQKVVFPARRAWAAVSTRVRARKTGSGGSILKLHEDVQTCGYNDVQLSGVPLPICPAKERKISAAKSHELCHNHQINLYILHDGRAEFSQTLEKKME
uniref:Uncharacterized protein n=1 Tax=Leersia perrieri TaxID=77586 RepID=A0A0D9W923_9ORYZ